MRLSSPKNFFMLALTFAVALPSLAMAQAPDVEFENATTLRAVLSEQPVQRFRFLATQNTFFDNVDVEASITGDELTIEDIELEEGDITVEVEFETAILRNDRLGASFNAPVTIIVDDGEDEVEITGRIRGRVTSRRGTLHLAAVVSGALSSPSGNGSGIVQSLLVTIKGTASAPDPN